jgi:hypothetical protein
MEANETLHLAVAQAMADIVAGDPDATWRLHTLAEPALRRMVRAEARRVGAWISDDDVTELALDGAIVLARHARSWKPDGALPWVWGRHRIYGLVHDHLGTFTRPIDDDVRAIEALPVGAPVDDPRAVLRSLAARHPEARHLEERLARVSERDADIFLRFQIERSFGNRAPAVTVAADHDMRPEAIRKVVQRVTERIGPDALPAAA